MKDYNPISLLQSDWEKLMYDLNRVVETLAHIEGEPSKKLMRRIGAHKRNIQKQIDMKIMNGEWNK